VVTQEDRVAEAEPTEAVQEPQAALEILPLLIQVRAMQEELVATARAVSTVLVAVAAQEKQDTLQQVTQAPLVVLVYLMP
jgi:hypothetical protein